MASASVSVDHLFQNRYAAVMHVRRGQRDVAQGRHAKLPHVGRAMGDVDQSSVVLRIASSPVHIVEARIGVRGGCLAAPLVNQWAGEIEARMALCAAGTRREEKR